MKNEGLPRTLRLRRRTEFLRVQHGGEKFHVAAFLVFIRNAKSERARSGERPLRGPRLGVTVTRKVGSAVVRNRIKRWVREAYRRQRAEFPDALDMVWVAKREAATAGFHGVAADMMRLSQKLRRRFPRAEGSSS